MTYRDEAKAAKASKVSRILGSANRSSSDAVMSAEGAKGTPPMTKAIDRGTTKVKGGASKKRLDKPARKRGGPVEDFKGTSAYKDMMEALKPVQKRVRANEAAAKQSDAWAKEDSEAPVPGFNPASRNKNYRKNPSTGQMGYYEKGGSVKRARGGSVKKGKTNVTVVVAPQGGAPAPAVSVAGGPSPVMPGAAPMAAPGAPAPAPMAAMPQRPPMAPSNPQGMPMRKRGGSVKMNTKAGAGGGLGRLEKAGMA